MTHEMVKYGSRYQFRANGEEINQGALTNIKYFASVDPRDNGGRKTINDNPTPEVRLILR